MFGAFPILTRLSVQRSRLATPPLPPLLVRSSPNHLPPEFFIQSLDLSSRSRQRSRRLARFSFILSRFFSHLVPASRSTLVSSTPTSSSARTTVENLPRRRKNIHPRPRIARLVLGRSRERLADESFIARERSSSFKRARASGSRRASRPSMRGPREETRRIRIDGERRRVVASSIATEARRTTDDRRRRARMCARRAPRHCIRIERECIDGSHSSRRGTLPMPA